MKRMIKRMIQRLGSIILRKKPVKKEDQRACCEMVEIDVDSEYVNETIGINTERKDYLTNIIFTLIKENTYKDYTSIMIHISKECKHPNELGFICYHLGVVSERLKSPIGTLFTVLTRK